MKMKLQNDAFKIKVSNIQFYKNLINGVIKIYNKLPSDVQKQSGEFWSFSQIEWRTEEAPYLLFVPDTWSYYEL